MLFAIDIDGTIAGTVSRAPVCRLAVIAILGIGLSAEKVAAFASYREFALSAEITSLWEPQENQDRDMQVLELAQHDAEVQRASLPLPCAVEGVKASSTYGRVIYVTCRYASSRELSQEWLGRKGFPSSYSEFPLVNVSIISMWRRRRMLPRMNLSC